MLFRSKVINQDKRIAEEIKKELIAALEKMGVTIVHLDIDVKSGCLNLAMNVNSEKAAVY